MDTERAIKTLNESNVLLVGLSNDIHRLVAAGNVDKDVGAQLHEKLYGALDKISRVTSHIVMSSQTGQKESPPQAPQHTPPPEILVSRLLSRQMTPHGDGVIIPGSYGLDGHRLKGNPLQKSPEELSPWPEGFYSSDGAGNYTLLLLKVHAGKGVQDHIPWVLDFSAVGVLPEEILVGIPTKSEDSPGRQQWVYLASMSENPQAYYRKLGLDRLEELKKLSSKA